MLRHRALPPSGVRRGLSFLGLPCVVALAVVACGSSTPSTSASSSQATFDPDSGVPPFSAGSTSHSSGTGSGTTTGTVVSSGTTSVTSSDSSSDTSTSSSAASTTSSTTGFVSSTGITITVIPDGTGIAQGLLTAMENAKVAVHMEMYLLTNSTYISELETLKQKGIDVKVILNQTFPTGTTASQTNASSYSTLMGAGVDVKWAPANPDGSSSGYTHEKTVIIDPGAANAQAWIMTMNLDTAAPKDNREYLAEDTSAADITEAETIFEADYAGTPTAISGNLVVAPTNAESMLLSLIESATTSIDMEAEEIDESGQEGDLFSALTAKAKAGVTVRLVLEDSTVASQATAVSDLQAAGGKVMGYVYGTGLDIHAKALVADGARAYVGSENFTGGSLGYNRELGVIFDEADNAGQVTKVDSTILSDFNAGSAYSSTSGG